MSEYEDDKPKRGDTLEDQIVELLKPDGFLPFEVVLTNGDRYLVSNPHALAFGRVLVTIFPPKGGMGLFRKNQIAGVELVEPAAACDPPLRSLAGGPTLGPCPPRLRCLSSPTR